MAVQIRDLSSDVHSSIAKKKGNKVASDKASSPGVTKWEMPPKGWIKVNPDANVVGSDKKGGSWRVTYWQWREVDQAEI